MVVPVSYGIIQTLNMLSWELSFTTNKKNLLVNHAVLPQVSCTVIHVYYAVDVVGRMSLTSNKAQHFYHSYVQLRDKADVTNASTAKNDKLNCYTWCNLNKSSQRYRRLDVAKLHSIQSATTETQQTYSPHIHYAFHRHTPTTYRMTLTEFLTTQLRTASPKKTRRKVTIWPLRQRREGRMRSGIAAGEVHSAAGC